MIARSPLNNTLADLERAELVRRLFDAADVYQFKHNLVQDTVYASLLRNDRRSLHRACAEAIERAFPENLDEYAPLLARHYDQAGDEARAFAYARRAGDLALRKHAYPEALMQYDLAIGAASRLPLDAEELVQLYRQRGRTLELMGRYGDAIQTYAELRALGQARGDPRLELGALMPTATLYTYPNPAQDLEAARALNEQTLALARQLGDREGEARSLWNMMQHAYFTGRPRDAIQLGTQALELAGANDPALRGLRAYILNDISRAYSAVGPMSQAIASLGEALTIFEEQGNLPMLADNLASTAEIIGGAGDFDTALRYAREVTELAEKIGNPWNLAYASITLTMVHSFRGEVSAALQAAERGIRFGHDSGFLIAAELGHLIRGELLVELGKVEDGLADMERANHPPLEVPNFMRAWWLGTRARIAAAQGDVNGAHELLELASRDLNPDDLSTFGPVAVALARSELALKVGQLADAEREARAMREQIEKAGIASFAPLLHHMQGRALVALGRSDEAAQVYARGADLARAQRARPMLYQILAALAALEAARGNGERAAALHAEARTNMMEIADSCPPELRASFLALPHVKELLNS